MGVFTARGLTLAVIRPRFTSDPMAGMAADDDPRGAPMPATRWRYPDGSGRLAAATRNTVSGVDGTKRRLLTQGPHRQDRDCALWPCKGKARALVPTTSRLMARSRLTVGVSLIKPRIIQITNAAYIRIDGWQALRTRAGLGHTFFPHRRKSQALRTRAGLDMTPCCKV